MTNRLVLASGSAARRQMLKAIGLDFTVIPAAVNEEGIKQARHDLTDEALALALARAKAEAVARRHPQALVIGADQLLVTEDGSRLNQPGSLAGVRATIERLQGQRHRLIAAAALIQDGRMLWSGQDTATLVMRSLDSAMIDHYVQTEGAHVLGCVGAYRIEGPGLALFDRVEGAYPVILGLPLMPLMIALRAAGVDPMIAQGKNAHGQC